MSYLEVDSEGKKKKQLHILYRANKSEFSLYGALALSFLVTVRIYLSTKESSA